MPIPPSFIPLRTAAKITASHLEVEFNIALAMLLEPFCDGFIEAWGGPNGEEPRQIPPQAWVDLKYKNQDLECDVIEVQTLQFFTWLGIVPLNWREMSSAVSSERAQTFADIDGKDSIEPSAQLSPIEIAIQTVRAEKGEPGCDITWSSFSDAVRDQCNAWIDRANGKPKRGFGDRTIRRFTKKTF